MHSETLNIGLTVLATVAGGLAQDVITDDTYFYGLSPPVYPSPNGTGTGAWATAYTKAQALVAEMTLEEKVNLTAGVTSSTGCSGYVPAIERLGFPGLCVTDAGNGVRGTDFVSAWPSGLHVGASWNRDLAFKRAVAMGKEALKKGVNTLLGPVVGPMFRLAEGGRNWEGFAADPFLSGQLVAESVTGLQDSGVMACVKHFIGNEQETQRVPNGNVSSVSSNVDDATLHEYYLWPFQDALYAGAASIMCSYNRLNNSYSCQNSKLLNGILKEELGFQGFVMSDWDALHGGYAAADAGLDMVMPDDSGYWGDYLVDAVVNGSFAESRVDDMATRIVASWYQLGQESTVTDPGYGMPANVGRPHTIVDAVDPADNAVLLQGAIEGHVLVKNTGALPLQKPRQIFIAGYSAREQDQNTNLYTTYGWSFAGQSSYEMTLMYGTSFISADPDTRSPVAAVNGTLFSGGGSGGVSEWTVSSPFHALMSRALTDGTKLMWDLLSPEPKPVASSDVCIVFGNAFATESMDRGGLRDNYTDTMIESVANGCANTVVVLHNAGVRIVENWIDHPNITAVVFAHLPGQESGNALVSLLYGESDFSGRLPYTVPTSEEDYDTLLSANVGEGEYEYFPQADFDEGVYIDYRHFDRADITPRYAFGYGLSYTNFSFSQLYVSSNTSQAAYPSWPIVQGGRGDLWNVVARVTAVVTNTGSVTGQAVPQLYVGIPGAPAKQLRGFDKVSLSAGGHATVTFPLTRRDLSVWDASAQEWKLPGGNYSIYVGADNGDLPLQGSLTVLVSA